MDPSMAFGSVGDPGPGSGTARQGWRRVAALGATWCATVRKDAKVAGAARWAVRKDRMRALKASSPTRACRTARPQALRV